MQADNTERNRQSERERERERERETASRLYASHFIKFASLGPLGRPVSPLKTNVLTDARTRHAK